jgi:hypothetical protein
MTAFFDRQPLRKNRKTMETTRARMLILNAGLSIPLPMIIDCALTERDADRIS